MSKTLLTTTTTDAEIRVTVPDAAMADAIETMIRLVQVAPTMPPLASWALRRNGSGTWMLRAQSGFHGNQAADIDAIREWATVLEGGITQLSEENGGEDYSYRELSAVGTLGGATQVTVWDHLDCTDQD